MIGAIQCLFKSQLKNSRKVHKASGFTLIELLVAMILAALVITPLLGFMINLLESDRREQAKAYSEQEIQAALDYISRDLEQAIYIYDGDGIKKIQGELPAASPEQVPVLVFWKREQVKNALSLNNGKCAAGYYDTSTNCNETFVYSLVAYYLVKDTSSTWSSAARISRFQIKDGVNILTGAPYPASDLRAKDNGFKVFDLSASGSTLEAKMNLWKKDGTFTQTLVPLVDYIDQSTSATPQPISCRAALSIPATDSLSTEQKLTTPVNTINTNDYTSFYACVDSKTNLAYVYLRGNALARIQNNAVYSSNSSFFPSSTIKIKGRGFLLVE